MMNFPRMLGSLVIKKHVECRLSKKKKKKKEKWSGLLCPPPGDLPNPGIEPRCPALQADSMLSEPTGKPGGS